MSETRNMNRRGFLAMAGVGVVASGFSSLAGASETRVPDPDFGLKLGVASYSLRAFPLLDALKMTKELGVRYITLKDIHLPMNSTPEQRKEAAKAVREAGLTLAGCGVIYLKNEEKQIRDAFEYVRDTGAPVMVAAPDLEALPTIEKMVKEFDIRVAIHNHGPGDKRYPSALDAYRLVESLDKRMGVCIDVGHTVRLGEKELEVIEKVKDRLYDFHIKDMTLREAKGSAVEVGRGVVDVQGVLKALLDMKFQGHIALEYEKDEKNPMPGMRESIEFIRKKIAANCPEPRTLP
ncbi:MAG TPA: sugar phosphate isomerase/epimerase [Candidatus Sumerlaeota bacterium]|nr:sugar phosphate isomerase/epimerase [Candidatus Sumerlaeota bacterium]HPS02379.1 sugar phosphate isomerase/epimerase [Candidatus Sumerlaeota bacterium]